MKSNHSSKYWILRIGAVSAIVGSLLGMVGNLIHPSTTGLSAEGVAQVIADSSLWLPMHMTIVSGLILMLLGLTAICRSINGGLAGAFSMFARSAAIAGITVGVLLVTLDGIAAKHLADAWAVAPDGEKIIALRILSAEETFNFAIAALFNILFAGVAYTLLGLAIVFSKVYKPWLGGIVIAAGVGSIVAGGIQAVTGESTGVTRTLTIIFPTIITLWTAYMGVLLYKYSNSLGCEGTKE